MGKSNNRELAAMGKHCDGTGKAHADAMKIVEFLIDQNGTTNLSQDEISRKLNFLKNSHTRGFVAIDKGRFSRAKNHVMDCVDASGKSCCGYRLHYRKSGAGGSTLSLEDPSGDLGSHAQAALGALLGWMSRERQHHTENRRQIVTFEALGDHALANGDKHGYRLVTQAIIDLDRDGTVLPETMAQLQVWASGLTVRSS